LTRLLATSVRSVQQTGEFGLCLKTRYWIEFSGILFQRQSIEFAIGVQNNEGCNRDSRTG
jgi:hypothetical protein